VSSDQNLKVNDFSKISFNASFRIMLVGDYSWFWYQEACAQALEHHGCEVERFGWFDDFRYWSEGCSTPIYHSFWYRIQYRLRTGPTVWRICWRLLIKAKKSKPDVIWFYNVQLIAPWVVRALRKNLPKVTLVQFANDNPFSTTVKPGLWRHYLRSIPLFDVHFSYRVSNISDYQHHGAKTIYLLRSYFIPDEDYFVTQEVIPDRFKCDVVFAGHYEDDGRVEMLEAICDAGYRLNLFGGGWDAAFHKLRVDSSLRTMYPISPVTKTDYRYAICGAKVALCFLSTLNRDTYTRRNFQIPAMRVAMLSQYTDDLASLYLPDHEAVFFRNKCEMLEKLKKLLCDAQWRRSVADAGHIKVYSAGHDVESRMRQFLNDISLRKNSKLNKI
jgi:spore maturation protein CgeB